MSIETWYSLGELASDPILACVLLVLLALIVLREFRLRRVSRDMLPALTALHGTDAPARSPRPLPRQADAFEWRMATRR